MHWRTSAAEASAALSNMDRFASDIASTCPSGAAKHDNRTVAPAASKQCSSSGRATCGAIALILPAGSFSGSATWTDLRAISSSDQSLGIQGLGSVGYKADELAKDRLQLPPLPPTGPPPPSANPRREASISTYCHNPSRAL